MSHRWTAAAAVLTALALQACDGSAGMLAGHERMPTSFRSNGERIYFTGTSASGRPIVYTGGGMHMQMMGGACATCHGADRRGRRMMPSFWIVAPPLTREALFEGESGHGEHEHYDDEALWRAVSRGVDPSGKALDTAMPRWSMTRADWDDLLAYLHE